MWKIYEFSLLHNHSLHIIFVSLSLSDEELELACVLYTYETPRAIVPNLYNWIGYLKAFIVIVTQSRKVRY